MEENTIFVETVCQIYEVLADDKRAEKAGGAGPSGRYDNGEQGGGNEQGGDDDEHGSGGNRSDGNGN